MGGVVGLGVIGRGVIERRIVSFSSSFSSVVGVAVLLVGVVGRDHVLFIPVVGLDEGVSGVDALD